MQRTARILIIFFIIGCTSLFSQGHIEHIKNQPYLKYASRVDCANRLGDNLSDRICANLEFQKSDSLLTQIYDSLLVLARQHFIDSLEHKIVKMQDIWRDLRERHCGIVYDTYEGCGGCHLRAISFLYCLKEFTDTRTGEFKALYRELSVE